LDWSFVKEKKCGYEPHVWISSSHLEF